MRRVAVVGSSGSGKTTLARSLSARLDVPHVELDALHHLPGWQERPIDEFRAAVGEAVAGDGWVVEGGYRSKLGDLVLGAAETVVWLDYDRWFVTQRIVRRTLRRAVTGEVLWNGNVEPLSNLYSRDPHRNVVVWSWTRHGPNRATNEAALDARWVRLRTPREAARWLAAVPVSPAGASP